MSEKPTYNEYVVVHRREIRRTASFFATSKVAAINEARALDEDESDSDIWETEDNDQGDFEVVEVKKP